MSKIETIQVGRSPGRTYQDLLDTDTKPVPVALREQSPLDLSSNEQMASVYFDPEFHRLEVERIWLRVWQFACREEVIPDVGDTEIYTIGSYSVLIVRTGPDEIKAFPNSCLHRGRLLRDEGGQVTELRCPFHSYAWNLDGTLKFVPSEWDFPHVDKSKFDLPNLPVGRWQGFVFISFDRNVEPFEQFLGALPSQFEQWDLANRFTEAHVAKVMRCNWKVAQEAFMESFHVTATHPQTLLGTGDTNSQYDVFGNFSRALTPTGTTSPNVTWNPSESEILDAMLDRGLDEVGAATVPSGTTARALTGAVMRESLRPTIGNAAADRLSDAELVDNIYYTLFPNFHPQAAFNRIVYRFRPYENDPEMSIFETLLLSPFKGERPPPASVHVIGPDESILEAWELGRLARIFDQDTFNMPSVQRGLHTMALHKSGVTLSAYQETKLRHFFAVYYRYLAQP
jgi:nitrite reductase/ring-hydroxylating ferredoxin subunit